MVDIPTTFWVQSPISSLDRETKEKELIDANTSWWKEHVIRQIFKQEEAEVICSLPLSRMGAEDQLVRGYTSKGNFSIKSAYHLEHTTRLKKMKG